MRIMVRCPWWLECVLNIESLWKGGDICLISWKVLQLIISHRLAWCSIDVLLLFCWRLLCHQSMLLQSQNPSKFWSLVLENMLEPEQVQMALWCIYIGWKLNWKLFWVLKPYPEVCDGNQLINLELRNTLHHFIWKKCPQLLAWAKWIFWWLCSRHGSLWLITCLHHP